VHLTSLEKSSLQIAGDARAKLCRKHVLVTAAGFVDVLLK